MVKAVILAGGKGTRMGDMTAATPKPLIKICDKAIIQYQLELLARSGIEEVTILSGYLGEQFEQAFGSGQQLGLKLDYQIESKAMGTAGALRCLADQIDSDFLLFSGDIMMNFDVMRFVDWHRAHPESLCSVIVHPNNHPFDSDLVETDSSGLVTRLLTRPHPEDVVFQNLSIASVYMLNPKVLDWISTESKTDLEKHFFPILMEKGPCLYAYHTHEYLKDAGTPKRFEQVTQDIETGKVKRAHREYARPAVFLDRDGVLNQERSPLVRFQDFQLIPGAAEAVQMLNQAGFLVIVITNQGAIAKGFLNETELKAIHNLLETELGRAGAYLDAIYYCPHYPESGFPGEVKELKIDCDCRKPATGLIERASQDLQVDLQQSFFIGDSSTDALAARRAGLRFIGVKTGNALNDQRCDLPADIIITEHLLEASQMIVSKI